MAQSGTIAGAYPEASTGVRRLRVWLVVVAVMVFAMVSLGGATRLTGSGLSITEWQPIIGAVPPLSDAAWQEAFAKYRQIPQYHHVNQGMSLEAFKVIYWWEWTHRFLGRLVGLAFLLPFLAFLALGQIPRRLTPALAGIFALGALQGFVGWYMVRSGLADRLDVSQYRLALHLTLAILILGALVWVILSLEPREKAEASPGPGFAGAAAIVGLLVLQVVLGAFVAGLKAGAAYNTWPLMDGRLLPEGLGAMQPWYLNLFENALTVQFNHRLAAYLLLACALWHALTLRRGANSERAAGSAALLAWAILAQALLGIWTLLAHVPLALALAHQAGAAALFALAVRHLHLVRHAAGTPAAEGRP